MDAKEALYCMRRWSASDRPPPGPYNIVAFLTNRCNLKCRHCWRLWGDWDRSFKTEVSDERWLRLVDETASTGGGHWSFLGGGEPLVRRDLLMEMIRKASRAEMTSLIHTNGILFTPNMIDELMDRNLIIVNFSIDGPDAETNDYIRGGGFDRAVANLRYFSERKQETRREAPETIIYATITNLTYNRIDEFIELAASIGPGVEVNLSALIVEEGDTATLALSHEQMEAFPEKVSRGMQRAQELGVKTNLQQYLDTEHLEDSTHMQHEVQPEQQPGLAGAMCYEPWLSAAILPDGCLGPCCALYDPQALSIRDSTLEEVWNGAYMTRVRAGMFDGNPPHYCARCPSNLYSYKEQMRIFLTEYLRRDHAAMHTQLAGALTRAGITLRDQGPLGLARRFREWLVFHTR